MKQRSKILTALFLSASLAVTPAASVSVLAEDLDFAAVEEIDVVPEEEISDSEEVSTSTEDSVLAADITTEDSDLTTDEFTADTSTFSTDEADVFTSGETSEQDVSEARTHSIKVSVINSSGVASGMYAMDSAVVTRQDDGTYLVRMHQTSVNRNYMALTDDKNKATNHEVDWYVAGGDDGYWYTIPVASLTDPLYASFSYTKNVNAGKAWGNVQTITFDVSSMAETEERDAVASDINKLPATNGPADYTSVDAALATVPEDLSIYTDETADAVRAAVAAVKRDYTMAQQADVDKMAQAITDAVNALVKKAVEEAKTHSIKVSVTNSEGVASGMYAMDDAIVTKQDDGTYLVKMHQASENRNYMALVNGTTADDIAAATQHKIDWYVADSSYYYTIPVASLSDTVYASFSKTTNVNKGSKWSNVQTITFDTTSMADTDKNDVDASGMNKQAALDYSSVDAALAAVPKDLSIYTDETVAAVRAAVDAVNKNCTVYQQADVDKMASDITAAVKALVKKPVAAAKVTLNATSKKITTGKSFTLKATVAPSNTTDKVVWKSSNTKVATVSANGTVKAVKAGTAVITATAGKVKATCKVTVANPVYKVTSIKLAAAPSRYITAGKRVQLRATITPSNATNKAVTWKSSNTRIATVSSTGIVTFNKNAGGKKVTITATAKDGSKKYARITLACMKGSVKSIRLSGKTTVTNGQSTKVTAAVTSQGGSANRSLAWSSSNTKLATVDKYGKVKTIKGKKGTVTITAKATDGSGKKATFKIRIK